MLECKKEAKYLRVIFDEKMQWSSQISNITKKVNFKLGKIKAVASFLTSHTHLILISSHKKYFHYCSPAWSSAAAFQLHKADKKVVDASNFLGWKDNYSIYNVVNKDMSLLIFKALNNLAPNYICSKINMARNSHFHNTRGAAKNHLQLSSANNKFELKTFACRAPKLWNDLPFPKWRHNIIIFNLIFRKNKVQIRFSRQKICIR